MNTIKRNDLRVAFDMTFYQFGWAIWLIGIVVVIFGGIQFFSGNTVSEGFFSFIENPYKIFMLVVGILSVPSFLSFYVKIGITRKHHFTGAALSSALLSSILMVIAVLVAGIEQLLAPTDVVTFLGINSSWILIFIIFTLNIFVYYIAGWLIGAGYYGYGGWGVLYSIIGALVIIFGMDLLWARELNTPVHRIFSLYPSEGPSLFVSFGTSFIIIAISLWIIRKMTKKVSVKM